MSVISFEEARRQLEKRGVSISQSQLSGSSETPGQTPTKEYDLTVHDLEMWVVLDRALRRPFTTKGQFARDSATIIACAADLGLISTRIDEERWGNVWFITQHGMDFHKGILNEITD